MCDVLWCECLLATYHIDYRKTNLLNFYIYSVYFYLCLLKFSSKLIMVAYILGLDTDHCCNLSQAVC